MDVNTKDKDGNPALHNAASRGDYEMIHYLASKGAEHYQGSTDRDLTTGNMANGPVQSKHPYPETIMLLESLGANNKRS